MAAAFLSFQQGSHPARDAGVAAPACGPVSPVPIERTGWVFHLPVSDNRHIRVPVKRQPVVGGKHPSVPLVRAPVALGGPVARLARVSVTRPWREFQVQPVVQALEDALADRRAVVMAPACNHRVAQPDQVCLPGRFVLSDDRPQLGIVALDGRLTRFDERFEAAFGVVPAHGVVADLNAAEVEAHWPPFLCQGVGNAGLLSVHFETNPLQPLCHEALTVLDDELIAVQDHEIVPLAHDLGLPAHLDTFARWPATGLGGELGAEVICKAVQRDIRQPRRADCPVGGAPLGLGEHRLIQHARLPPTVEQPSEVRGRRRLASESVMVDAVEAFGDIGIQHIFGLFTDRDEDRPARIVHRSSGAEPIAVGREPGLPLGFHG
jgi:hypothetical protein